MDFNTAPYWTGVEHGQCRDEILPMTDGNESRRKMSMSTVEICRFFNLMLNFSLFFSDTSEGGDDASSGSAGTTVN